MLHSILTGYAERGWAALPLPPRSKTPPPAGHTGRHGIDPTPDELEGWGRTYPADSNVALRVPAGVIGLDVDAYAGKPGAASLAERVAELGPLPDTWSSTSRGNEATPGDSRILFYRLPEGAGTHFRSDAGAGIDIIQRSHRYAVVYPSVHPDGRVYRWHAPDGTRTHSVPSVSELAELPAAWAAWLAEPDRGALDIAEPAAGSALLSALEAREGDACGCLVSLAITAADRMSRAGQGSRHDTMTALVYRLVASAAAGHPGYPLAQAFLSSTWDTATAGEDRGAEFVDMVTTAARKVAVEWAGGPSALDPCTELQVRSMVPPAGPLDLAQAGTDRQLARAVLAHVRGRVRFLTDAARWMVMGADNVWHGALDLTSPEAGARVILDRALDDALRGDATAEKGADERRRADNYTRLSMNAGASAAAGMMVAAARNVDYHGATTLARMDSEPTILWAGGVAWDLAASLGRLVTADLDPLTPHLKSAGYTPQLGEAPHWDAFLSAMIPDAAHREWVMHLLGAALVGTPARMMPIAYGPPGIGKTQLFTLVSDVMGDGDRGYATAADRRLLGDENHHASVLMQLAGRRFAWVDEGPRSGRASIERLKALTGGGQMTANAMRSNPVTFRPTHTLALTTNDEPELADDALRDRVRLISLSGDPEQVAATRHALGDTSGRVWQAEAPVVLGRLITYAARWLADPTTTANPVDVTLAMEEVARGQDIVRLWVSEECAPTGWTSTSSLYAAFREYALSQGVPHHRIPTANRFGRELTKHGVEALRTNTTRGYVLQLRRFGGGDWTPQTPRPSITVTPQLPPDAAADTPAGGGDASVPQTSDAFLGFSPVPCDEAVTHPQSDASSGAAQDASPAIRHRSDSVEHASSDAMTDRCPISLSNQSKVVVEEEKEGENVYIGGKGGTPPHPSPRHEPVPRPSRAVDRLTARREAERVRPEAQPAPEPGAEVRPALPAVKRRGAPAEPITVPDAQVLLAGLTGVTVDVEHTGYPIGHKHFRLRTIQLGDADRAVVLDAGDPEQLAMARATLDDADVIVAHWGAADLVPIAAACGIDPEVWWVKFTDTAVLTGLTNPGERPTDARGVSVLGLKGLAAALVPDAETPGTDAARAALFKARRWLTNTEPSTDPARSGWAQVDPADPVMIDYAASDVLDTARLASVLIPRVPAVPGLLERERTVQRITARLASRGLRLDPERVAALADQARADMAAAAAPMAAYGVTDPASTTQLAEAFTRLGADLPTTPKTGKVSTAKAGIARLSYGVGDAADLARLLLEWRKPETLLSSFVTPYSEQITHGDGIIRPVIMTLGADATGRMSSVRPNIQQVPRSGGVRECVMADPGHVFAAADFSSVEVRIAAWVSEDVHLAQMIRDGVDMHGVIAGMVWGDAFTKAQRYDAKRAVFGRLYGAGLETIARGLGRDADRASDVIAALDAAAPGLAAWSAQLRDAVRLGAATHWTHRSGRRTWFTRDAPHKAVNYVIQSTGRELLVDAMLAFEARMPGHTVVPVHDELLVMVPEHLAAQATATLTECMTLTLTTTGGITIPIDSEADEPSPRWTSST